MLPAKLKHQFVSALHRMLRPVVQQLIAYGVSYATFSEMMKQLYVDVAEHDLPLPFKRQTDSRLAVATGINRKEIALLRRARGEERGIPEVEDTVVTHVIGRWMAGPPYCDASGRTRPLPYDMGEGRAPSFSSLVRDVGPSIPIRALLDEFLRLGVVVLEPGGHVVLRREAHIPPGGMEGKLTLLASDPAELFSTIMHNIEHPESPRLQRKVVYDNIGSEALSALREAARAAGEKFIRDANALISSYDRDRNPRAPAGQRSRVAMGIYYFEEEDLGPDAPPGDAGRKPAPPGRIKRSK